MFGVLSTFFNTILNANVCLGETDAGRGVWGERGGGSGGISDWVRERRGGFCRTGAEAGSFCGTCSDRRFGDKRLSDGSGILGGSIRGGRLAHGDPREPRRSFNPIGGGGEAGGSSSAAATTTTGSAMISGAFGSVTSDVIDLLK